ncbi:MAG TPA: nucleotidyltransferase domain-containing protein [Nanoarchaeota archaeon]|nr:nucleotidyltransferase domain-containing protein [Nanoarchaeota archaeon]HIJ04868.1 nucleotidyltransferase domain-containing protein [Nanoarchaeota archaeon]
MILTNIKLRNSLKKIVRATKSIDDILLFGSIIRGKQNPQDIDIMILFKEKVDKATEYKIRKELEKYAKNISIVSKTQKTAIEQTFDARESILFECISLLSGKNLAKEYGFSSLGMLKYKIKGWTNLQKTQFYHALNGRSGKGGVLEQLSSIKLSDNIILTPLNRIELMKDFLDFWKIEYLYIPLLIPHRMNHKNILEEL